jgi:UDP-N-acetylmuramate dehydrogenase
MPLNSDEKEGLQAMLGSNLRFDEPMSKHTYLRVGGPADAWAAPQESHQLIELIQWLDRQALPCFVMGSGSNLLVKDGGIRGVVISLEKCLCKIQYQAVDHDRVVVIAQAGAKLYSLCRYAAQNGFEGLNFALGIPGSVGGGIIMNAGTHMGSMQDVVKSVSVLSSAGRKKRIDRKDLLFSYRALHWHSRVSRTIGDTPIIWEGEFDLQISNREKIQTEADTILKKRRSQQPLQQLSAGCFFKNPADGKTAGELIDTAGLKGKRIGDAEISTTHANFIINRGRATAADIMALKDLIQETIYQLFDIYLETEVKIVGT